MRINPIIKPLSKQASNPRANVMDFSKPTTLRVPSVPSGHAAACPAKCHCVRPGETLDDIALLMGTSTQALTAINPHVLRQGNRLFVGQTLAVLQTADTTPPLPPSVEIPALQSPYAVLLRIPGLPLTPTYLHGVAKANGLTLEELAHIRVRGRVLKLLDREGKLVDAVESPAVEQKNVDDDVEEVDDDVEEVDDGKAVETGMDAFREAGDSKHGAVQEADIEDEADEDGEEDWEDDDDAEVEEALGFDRFPGDGQGLPLPKKQLPPPSKPPSAAAVPSAPERRSLQAYARLPIKVSAAGERRSMRTEEDDPPALPWDTQAQQAVRGGQGSMLMMHHTRLLLVHHTRAMVNTSAMLTGHP